MISLRAVLSALSSSIRSTLETTSKEGTAGGASSEGARLADGAGVLGAAVAGGIDAPLFQVQQVGAEDGDDRLRGTEELDPVQHRIHPAHRDAVVLVVRLRVVNDVVVRRQDQTKALQGRGEARRRI